VGTQRCARNPPDYEERTTLRKVRGAVSAHRCRNEVKGSDGTVVSSAGFKAAAGFVNMKNQALSASKLKHDANGRVVADARVELENLKSFSRFLCGRCSLNARIAVCTPSPSPIVRVVR
jgi:hypothetical protein